ncbi:MAG: hypothetical protein H0U65_16280 [Rubrobacter sp.]|jgi:predicted nucleic acid-binding protein|nr:hypothetical protein [Rubrobacter sp.]
MRDAVFDAGPLIYLDALGYLPALSGLYDVVVPDAVSEELARNKGAFGSGVPSMEGVAIRTPDGEDSLVVESGPPAIDAGEKEVIALVLGTGALAIIDDRRGVRRASRLGVEVAGTLVVLIQIHRAGHAHRTFEEDLGVLDDAGMYLTDAVKRSAAKLYRGVEDDE